MPDQKVIGAAITPWVRTTCRPLATRLLAAIPNVCIALCVAGLPGCHDESGVNNKTSERHQPALTQAQARAGIRDRQNRSLREFVGTLPMMRQRPQCQLKPDPVVAVRAGFPDLELGMHQDDVLTNLSCERGDYHIITSDGFFDFETYDTQLRAQYIQLTTDNAEICQQSDVADHDNCRTSRGDASDRSAKRLHRESLELWTPGLPGAETLLGAWREQSHPKAGPSPDIIVRDLTAQFGEPSFTEFKPGISLRLGWGKDREERPISARSPFSYCLLNLDPGSSHNSYWREPCGWTAGAIILLSDDSRAVERYWVAMMDQHALIESGQAMRAEIERAHASLTTFDASTGLPPS